MNRAVLAVGSLVALLVRADLHPPKLPSIPEGIADARGRLGFLRARGAGVLAVDLSTGAIRWSSSEGEWPLYAGQDTVAVAAIDPASPGALRVRFLRLADGRRVVESEPISLPRGLRIPHPRKMPDRSTPSFAVRAWVPPPGREPVRDGRLRVRWDWSFTPAYGYRPPSPDEARRASGVVLIDPENGRVTPGDDEREPPADPPAELPPTFRPQRGLLYWAFSDHGASWSSAPTPFGIGTGVRGAFAWEPGGARRLTLLRWRGQEPLPSLELGRGAAYAPVVALGGRFVAMSEQKGGRERVLLHDLAEEATAPLAELPPFGRQCEPPFAIVGGRMLCVHESDGEPTEGGTLFPRELVGVRTDTGKREWSVALAPRLLAAPVPGGMR